MLVASILLVVARDQLAGDRTVGVDHHTADGSQLGAGLRQKDVIAGFVFYGLALHGAVGMPVDERVDPGGVCNDVGGAPWRGLGIGAQMPEGDRRSSRLRS